MMTRIISFLISWLVDWWKRNFNYDKYLAWDEDHPNADPHNFRVCSNCGRRISELYPYLNEEKCDNDECREVLHKKGVYKKINRDYTFVLKRPLGNVKIAIMQVFSLIAILIGLIFLRMKTLPQGYELATVNYSFYLFLIAFLFVGFLVFAIIHVVTFLNEKIIELKGGSKIYEYIFVAFLALCVLGGVGGNMLLSSTKTGFNIVPSWIEVPTQQEWNDQQCEKLQAMPLTHKRLGFALEIAKYVPQVNTQQEFIKIAEENLENLMRVYSFKRLESGSEYQKRFYEIYRTYLASLDNEALRVECETDPWNIATGLALQHAPSVWEACKNVK